jgi:hypothetical protein
MSTQGKSQKKVFKNSACCGDKSAHMRFMAITTEINVIINAVVI